jgi:hypothetical protein
LLLGLVLGLLQVWPWVGGHEVGGLGGVATEPRGHVARQGAAHIGAVLADGLDLHKYTPFLPLSSRHSAFNFIDCFPEGKR